MKSADKQIVMPEVKTKKRTDRLNAGFIGVGNFVSGNHLPNMASSELWNVHSICDLNRANLDRAVQKYEPSYSYTDYRKLLENPEVDVVVLGVRHQDHKQLIQEASAAGKHIFVEKPMSMNNHESAEIISAVRDAGVRLMVGFNRRFSPAYSDAKAIFQKHHRGKRTMMTFRAVEDGRMWPRWPFDINDGGGLIISECCHFFDFICWFLEAEPVRIFCEGYREDENLVTMRLSDGSIGSIISGSAGSVCYPKERIEVFSDSTTLVVDQCLELHVEGYKGEVDREYPFKKDPFPDTTLGRGQVNDYREKMRQWKNAGISPREQQAKAYYGSSPGVNKGHFQAMEAFARSILNGMASPCDEIDGARATACCMAAVKCMEEGFRPVDLTSDEYFLSKKRR